MSNISTDNNSTNIHGAFASNNANAYATWAAGSK